ncbi:hypothetical protein CXB51_034973 [Gossypium anomalum]|uniref:Uncharacterized protein n=1 Tax=Gossypium anomalum TaxID=47600 RepID=A0A8J6CHU7_9ROSI|nr:hypothetical protein CXB51_034973 [Gossypium anomalum]
MKREVMHRADWDILWLQREFGIHLCNLFDTGQASRRIYLGKLLEIKGAVEVYISCGDRHSVVAIRNKLIVYGEDCGVGAHHAIVSIETKVFIIGGTGDKRYYNNVWVLDMKSGISICGGYGEDEHPIKELLHLSPSQSNQEQAPLQNPTSPMVSHGLNLFKPLHHIPINCQLNSVPNNRKGIKYMYLAVEHKHMVAGPIHNLLGTEVRGKVDEAFDSSFLMTTIVNKKLLREVLFSSGQGLISRELILATTPTSTCHVVAT